MNTVIKDKELGEIITRVNPRAKRLVFRVKNGLLYVTMPRGAVKEDVVEAIDKLRDKLKRMKQKPVCPRIDLDYRIDAEFFKLSLVSGEREKFLSHSELGETLIVCPPSANFGDESLQMWLRKVITEALRRNAEIVLPPRLYMLAQRHGFSYESVKINSSRGRWGSCSVHKSINLSCFLMLLPSGLIDYVLLHELCHIREMNHGKGFWDLLDSLTDGKALELRAELKGFKAEI